MLSVNLNRTKEEIEQQIVNSSEQELTLSGGRISNDSNAVYGFSFDENDSNAFEKYKGCLLACSKNRTIQTLDLSFAILKPTCSLSAFSKAIEASTEGILRGKSLIIRSLGSSRSLEESIQLSKALVKSKCSAVDLEGEKVIASATQALEKGANLSSVTLKEISNEAKKPLLDTFKEAIKKSAFIEDVTISSKTTGLNYKTLRNFNRDIAEHLAQNKKLNAVFPGGYNTRKGHQFFETFLRSVQKDANGFDSVSVILAEFMGNTPSTHESALAMGKVNQDLSKAFGEVDTRTYKQYDKLKELYRPGQQAVAAANPDNSTLTRGSLPLKKRRFKSGDNDSSQGCTQHPKTGPNERSSAR